MGDNVKKWVYTILAAAMVIATISLFVVYNKFGAKWWILPVILVGVVVAAVAIWIMFGTGFAYVSYDYPKAVAIIMVLAFLFCSIAGVYFTEPVREGKDNYQIQQERTNYSYTNSRIGYWWYFSTMNSGGNSGDSHYFGSSSSSSSSSKGVALAFLIILVILLIIGSAIFPHFWVMALIVITALMVLFALLEWLDL